MNKEQSIIISIRFTGILQQIKTIIFFSNQFTRWFGKSISELNYTITDKSRSNWKQITKSLKFNDSNLLKFNELLAAKNEKINIDFELLRNLEHSEYKSRDIDFSISYIDSKSICSLSIILNTSFYRGIDLKVFIEQIVNLLIHQNCKIFYSFVFNLENSKMPAFYAEGIGNEKLTKKEESSLLVWSNNKHTCADKIWDIFWGNIISSNHILNSNTLNDIEKIVGKENIILLAPNLIWFNLSEPLTDFDNLKYSPQRKELCNLFKSKLML